MARDRKTIKFAMTSAFISNATIASIYGLIPGKTFEEQFSLVSFENILFDIISFALSVHEQLTDSNATNSKSQNLPNLKQSLLDFRDGLELVWINSGWNYDLTGVDDEAARRVINRVAVLEPDDGGLVYKIATDNAGNLEPVAPEVYERVKKYIKKKKVPGIPFDLINIEGDLIKADLTIYVNPLMIDMTTGKLLNTADEVFPAKDGIKNYLNELEFDGNFIVDFFKSSITKQPGMFKVTVNSIQWKYSGFPFVDFEEFQVPESGYFKILDADLTINYLSDALVTN